MKFKSKKWLLLKIMSPLMAISSLQAYLSKATSRPNQLAQISMLLCLSSKPISQHRLILTNQMEKVSQLKVATACRSNFKNMALIFTKQWKGWRLE